MGRGADISVSQNLRVFQMMSVGQTDAEEPAKMKPLASTSRDGCPANRVRDIFRAVWDSWICCLPPNGL